MAWTNGHIVQLLEEFGGDSTEDDSGSSWLLCYNLFNKVQRFISRSDFYHWTNFYIDSLGLWFRIRDFEVSGRNKNDLIDFVNEIHEKRATMENKFA